LRTIILSGRMADKPARARKKKEARR
jgi:hypothetical protein